MNLRNIAIIAHVDHGKTTLIDVLLRQSGMFRDNQRTQERMMDTGDLERERGITIMAKVTSLEWHDTRINIVDTPGHADFGGEVERILHMVDSAIILVDAAEGPMPQTKFVLSKALKIGLKPIVVINKIDRPDARADAVVNEVFDLFVALDADAEQLDFPILYGSAKHGWMAAEPDGPQDGIGPLLDLVVAQVAPPVVEEGPFRMLATTIEANPYLGRLLTGKVVSGRLLTNQPLVALSRDGKIVEQGRASQILAFRGIERQPIDAADAGDIVSIAGLSKASVADTLTAPGVKIPIMAQPIDPPTLSMSFRVNDGPLAGKEGSKVQSRVIGDRLMREAEGNVALEISRGEEADSFVVAGRGELQLAILIETMRREGFELTVGRPRVVMQTADDGTRLEPIEEVTIDVDDEFSGVVVQKLSERRADLLEMRGSGAGRTRLVFVAPTRGLIGYQPELLSDTRGTATFNRVFKEYASWKGPIPARGTGVLISNGQGDAVAFAIWNLEDRGQMFVVPGDKTYAGMIVGEHSRGNDLVVNVLKGKQLTNIRSAGKDEAVRLTPVVKMTLEKALSYIADDELVEVTPKSLRMRKFLLDPHARKRAARASEAG